MLLLPPLSSRFSPIVTSPSTFRWPDLWSLEDRPFQIPISSSPFAPSQNALLHQHNRRSSCMALCYVAHSDIDAPASGPHTLACGSYSPVHESHVLCSSPSTSSSKAAAIFWVYAVILCNFLLLCSLLVNPNRMRLFGVNLFSFIFWKPFFHSYFHLNFHGFLGSLFRCLIGVFILQMVESITSMCHGKSFFGLHSHISFPSMISFLFFKICLVGVLVSLPFFLVCPM